MIDYVELWFLLGIVSAFYKYMDLKHYDKIDMEQLDYYVLFIWVIGGILSFVVVIKDIIQKRWWDE